RGRRGTLGGSYRGQDPAARSGRTDGIAVVEGPGFAAFHGANAGRHSRGNAGDRKTRSHQRSAVRGGDFGSQVSRVPGSIAGIPGGTSRESVGESGSVARKCHFRHNKECRGKEAHVELVLG